MCSDSVADHSARLPPMQKPTQPTRPLTSGRYGCAVTTGLLKRLAAAPGLYRGRGDGLESGPFVARIVVASLVRGRVVTIDYEAFSDGRGLQHVEHSLLTLGEGGGLELHVTCSELPGVVRFVE